MSTVLAVVPYYLPYPGGAEKSMHEMLSRMVQLGFTAEALVPLVPSPVTMPNVPMTDHLDGVLVRRLQALEWVDEVAVRAREADLIFFSLAHLFHLYFDTQIDRIMNDCWRRVIYFCRGNEVTDYFPAALVVANSQAVMDDLPERPGVRTCVLKPIISAPTIQPQLSRRFVTLINPCDLKGGEMLLHLASRFPDVPFLAQLGRNEAVKGLDQLPGLTHYNFRSHRG